MGEPFAEQILKSGMELNLYNRTQSKLSGLKAKGGKVYADISLFIKNSETIIIFLSDYHAICEFLFDSNIGSLEGKTIIQMGTIAPDESEELFIRIEKLRGEYAEAPVLGSIPQIRNNELIVLFGGSRKVYDQLLSFFKGFASKVLFIGSIGQAAAMKLALNQLIVSETVAFSMSLGYLRNKNLDINIFMDILRGSALYAPTFDKKLQMMLDRDFNNPNFPLKHLLKDLDLILGEFAESNINTNSLKGIRKILIDSIQNGLSDKDYSALYNSVHPKENES